ncbi:MAG: hypothetical protein K2O57_01665 [Acetatifactor sp.]|nr:hypothetical protein [Acetatifactor sp.]
MVEETKGHLDEIAARQALEEAREAESKAYNRMKASRDTAFTERQKGMLKLAQLQELDAPDKEQLDQKCKLILESYYLPHILKDGCTVELEPDFTRFEDSDRDYIEAVFTLSSGRKRNVGYNYKIEEDGKSLILFEKTFENVILEPGKPDKYVLYDADGVTELESVSMEELEERVSRGEVVKVEEEYFQKARDESGAILKGDTTMIIEDEGNSKILLGNNAQEKFSFNKAGQLVCALTNDVTTVTVETRKFASPEPIYDSAEAARAAAEKEIQEGETNLRVDTSMEGTTVAEFNFVPVYTTNIELAGVVRKLGKGVEGYNAADSDEENLRRQFAKPISEYLDEKGFHVIDISCNNLESNVTENVGWMNTIKTFQMTGGEVTVSYTKRLTSTVTIKQGFLGRGQNNDISAILAQLPEGSELLNPQDIDWKNSKPEVAYVMRGSVKAEASAKTIAEADTLAADNAILAAQKIAVRGLNGGISAGIKEVISANGAASTVANVRAKMDVPVVRKEDMQLTHKDARYAYTGSCDRMITSVDNKLVSVTTWNGSKLTYVEPTDPVIDRGIPTDENYDKYVNDGDDMGILLFEKTDQGLHRYMDDVKDAQAQAKSLIVLYEKARTALKEAQEKFDQIYDEGMTSEEVLPEEISEDSVLEKISEDSVLEEPDKIDVADKSEEAAEIDVASEADESDKADEAAEKPLTAHEALLAIFGDDGME